MSLSLSKEEFKTVLSDMGLEMDKYIQIKVMGIPFAVSIIDPSRRYYYQDIKNVKISILGNAKGKHYNDLQSKIEPYKGVLPSGISNMKLLSRAIPAKTFSRNFDKKLIELVGQAKEDIRATLDGNFQDVMRQVKLNQDNSYIISEFVENANKVLEENSDKKILANWKDGDKEKKEFGSVISLKSDKEISKINKVKEGDYESILRSGVLDLGSSDQYKVSVGTEQYYPYAKMGVELEPKADGCYMKINLKKIKVDPSNLEIIKKALELIELSQQG